MRKEASCCVPDDARTNNCKVEAVVSVDERGQMVLPKELRDRAKIRAGDKLAVVGCERDGEICCLSDQSRGTFCNSQGLFGPYF
jgi:AbrB family looped-hinge helix DNA binding protein